MEIKKLKVAMSGPSGLGKTTLCNFIAGTTELKHLSTSAGNILTDSDKEALHSMYGYEGTGHKDVINLSSINPNFGIDFQGRVLHARMHQIENNKGFVIDRSPIDNVVYMLSQVGHNSTEEHLSNFIKSAQAAYSELTHVIMIKYSNDIPQIEDNKSRVANRYFQQYISDVFTGVYLRHFAHILGPRVIILDYWNLKERQETVAAFLKHTQTQIEFK